MQGYLGGYQGRVVLENITLINVDVNVARTADNGFTYVGGLAGDMPEGSITDVCVSGVIVATSTSVDAFQRFYVGGLVGRVYNSNSTITNACAAVDITVTSEGTALITSYTGGLVGHISKGKIIASYATGDVTSTD